MSTDKGMNTKLSQLPPNIAVAGFNLPGLTPSPLCYLHLQKALMIAGVQDKKVILTNIINCECQLCQENKLSTGVPYAG